MQTNPLNNKPAVSIGMPVYNGEKFIREAIDSLLAQTFTDFELIISDNCSTDKTQEICNEYLSRDSRITYFRQSANIGAVANFEYVLNAAQGKFFMWAACDDYLGNKDYLSVMVNKVMEGYDFCFPDVKLLLEGLERKSLLGGTMNRFSNCLTSYDFCKETVLICSYQIYGVFDKQFLNENYKYIKKCTDLRCYGEGLFVHAISSKASLAYVPAANLVYRRHATNTSTVQPANYLLVDFFKFSYRLFSFYLSCKTFTFFQKLSIITSISYVHGKYSFILIYAYFLQVRKCLLKIINLTSSDPK